MASATPASPNRRATRQPSGGNATTVVIKIGTSSIVDQQGHWDESLDTAGCSGASQASKLSLSVLSKIVEVVTTLKQHNCNVVIVTSGAVGVGARRLGMTEKPKDMATKQAVAAVGQGRLLRIYDDLFELVGVAVAQVLLTRLDIAAQAQYVNIYNTFHELLRLGVVPIVNENDTVATEELMGVRGKYGDNDSLSALVAGLVEADWLFLLTDIDRLYTADPRTNPDAQPIDYVPDIDALGIDESEDSAGSAFGTGGIGTKLNAARLATAAGVQCVLCHSQRAEHICKFVQGSADAMGTVFAPKVKHAASEGDADAIPDAASVSLNNRRKWIVHGIAAKGRLVIDAGAARAVLRKKSLLAAGVTAVSGDFAALMSVQIVDSEGNEIARALTNYNASEVGLSESWQAHKAKRRTDGLATGYGPPYFSSFLSHFLYLTTSQHWQ
eukprot:SAG11_NODE_2554_length_3224_cov_3.493760_2_plen_441_part_00